MALLRLTVSQLNAYVQRTLQSDALLRDVEVSGEIGNFKLYGSGMLFFSLRDAQATLPCVMFAEDASRLSAAPCDGMRVIARGSAGLYAKGGQYRMTVREMHAEGVGPLYERLQQLRARLEREGLFDAARKRPIPRVLDTLGVVSSPTGAVIHDIIRVATRRDPQVRILLCPSRVQGIGAAEEVARAIACLERVPGVSAIVVARGGGSLEDLWAFNEEAAVRAVAACKKPVVSAIGHETDVTLCDLAADLRAPTPSAAAECAVSLRDELLDELRGLRTAMADGALDVLREKESSLALAAAHLEAGKPQKRLDRTSERLDRASQALRAAIRSRLSRAEGEAERLLRELALVDPSAVLRRGYAIVERGGSPVTSAGALRPGESVRLRFSDGAAGAVITEGTEGTEGKGGTPV